MAVKSLRKKRNYTRKVREQVVAGLINDAGGGWVRADSGKAMHRDMVAGYKIGRTKRRKVKTAPEVE